MQQPFALLQTNEKELLGFYVSGHPLQPLAKLLDRYANHTIEALATLPTAHRRDHHLTPYGAPRNDLPPDDPRTMTSPSSMNVVAGDAMDETTDVQRLYRWDGLTRFVAEQLGTAHWFDIAATRADLAWEPAVPLDEGFARPGARRSRADFEIAATCHLEIVPDAASAALFALPETEQLPLEERILEGLDRKSVV